MKLPDENLLSQIAAANSGKFMLKPQTGKKFGIKTVPKKKSVFWTGTTGLFEEESIEFNDYDSNILNRNLIKYLPTDALRLELQMERAEKKLKKIDDEIIFSNTLNLNEEAREELLIEKKFLLHKEIDGYKLQYRDLGTIYRISDALADFWGEYKKLLFKIKYFLKNISVIKKFLHKFPGYTEKQKLKKLNMLQQSILTEINKKSPTDTKKLETLFLKKEELGG